MSYNNSVADATINFSDLPAIRREALKFAEREALKLFAIDPVTRAGSFYDAHGDKAVWEVAFAADMQLGISACLSECLLFDVDVHGPEDREEAWQHYTQLCTEMRLTSAEGGVPVPYGLSKSGGWHFGFRVPPGFADQLRKGHHKLKISHFRELKPGEKDSERISVRWRALNVFPGSVGNGGGVYRLAANPQIHPYGPNTAGLFEWYAGLEVGRKTKAVTSAPPTDECTQSDAECAKLERFVRALMLKDPHWFEDRDNRLKTIWGIKRAGFGHRGYAIAEIICDVIEDRKGNRLNRYWNDPGANAGTATLDSFWKHCAKAGVKQTAAEIGEWKGREVMKSFSEVAQVAASDAPSLAPGASMLGNTPGVIADLAAPTVDEFLACTTDVPAPSGSYPLISQARHYPAAFAESLSQAVGVVAAMGEPGNRKAWRPGRVLKLLAVVKQVDKMTFTALVDRIKMAGLSLPAAHLAQACHDFDTEISNVIFGAARTAFIRGANGRPDSGNSDNVAIFLNLSARKARFDSFTRSIEIAKGDAPFKKMDQILLDDAFVEARSSTFDFQAKQDFFRTSVKSIARRETYDSLETHVATLPKWDGVRRLDTWLARVCGVDEDQYHAIAGRTIIGGMIARARRPGCYFRYVLLLIGTGQNEGKTYLCRILAGDDWVCVGFRLSGSEQNMRPKLAGKWVVELGEMAGLTRDNIEDVKTFLSEQDDEFVAKYEAETTRHPRRCVFIGTSNNEEPLLDDNNHRFLPVYIRGGIDIQWLKGNRDQLLAEAAHLDEQPGHSWDIPKGDADKLIREKQEAARFKGALEDQIGNWFGNVGGPAYILGNDLQTAFRMAGHGANVRPRKFMEKAGFRRALVGSKRDRAWVKGAVTEAVKLVPSQVGGPNMPVTFREIVSPRTRYEFEWNGLTVVGEGPFTPEDVIELRTRFPSLRPAAPAAPRQGVWQQIERPDLPMGWRVSQRLN
jgi:hypothetical protein